MGETYRDSKHKIIIIIIIINKSINHSKFEEFDDRKTTPVAPVNRPFTEPNKQFPEKKQRKIRERERKGTIFQEMGVA